jgi:hypothetical protein
VLIKAFHALVHQSLNILSCLVFIMKSPSIGSSIFEYLKLLSLHHEK